MSSRRVKKASGTPDQVELLAAMDQSARLIDSCRSDVDRLLGAIAERSPHRLLLQSISDRLGNVVRELNVEQRAPEPDVRTIGCSASAAKRVLRSVGTLIVVAGAGAQVLGVSASSLATDLGESTELAIDGVNELQICLALSSGSTLKELDRLLDELERATILAEARLRELRHEIPQPSLTSNLDYAAGMSGSSASRTSTARSELGISLHNLKSIGDFAGLGQSLNVRARIDSAMGKDVLIAQLEALRTTLADIRSDAEGLGSQPDRQT